MSINPDFLSTQLSLLSLNPSTSSASSNTFNKTLPEVALSRITDFLNAKHQINSRSICLNDLLNYIRSGLVTALQQTYNEYTHISHLLRIPPLTTFPRLFSNELYKILGPTFMLQQCEVSEIDSSTLSRFYEKCQTAPQKLYIYCQLDPRYPHDIRHIIIAKLFQNLTSEYPGLKTHPVFKKDDEQTHLSGFGVDLNGLNVHFVFQTTAGIPISCTQEALTLTINFDSQCQDVTIDDQMGPTWTHDTIHQILRPCTTHLNRDPNHFIWMLKNGNTLAPHTRLPLSSRPLMSLIGNDFLTPLLIAIAFGDTPRVRECIHTVLSRALDVDNDFFFDSLKLMHDENLSIDQLQALMQCIAHFGHVTRPGIHVTSDQTKCSFTIHDQVLTIASDSAATHSTISTLSLETMCSESFFKWLSSFTNDPELFWIQTLSHRNADVAQKLLQHSNTAVSAKIWATSFYIQTNPDIAVRLMQHLVNDVSDEQMIAWTKQLPQHTLFYTKLLASSRKWARACVHNDLSATIESIQTVPESSGAIIEALQEHKTSDEEIELLLAESDENLQQIGFNKLLSHGSWKQKMVHLPLILSKSPGHIPEILLEHKEQVSQDTLLQLLPLVFNVKTIKRTPQFISWALHMLHTYDGALNKAQKAIINQQCKPFIMTLQALDLPEELIIAIQVQQKHTRQDLDVETKRSLVWAFSHLAKDHPLRQYYISLVETHILQPKHAPFLQAKILLTSEAHIEYLTQLKCLLTPDELAQIRTDIQSETVPASIQTLFTPPAPKKKAATQSSSPLAHLVAKKNWSEIAKRLLQMPPSNEHESQFKKTIDGLLALKGSHSTVLSLLIHYRISSLETWKKVLKQYENSCDTPALTSSAITIIRNKDLFDKKCLSGLFEEIFAKSYCLNHTDALIFLQEFETIVTVLGEKLLESSLRTQMAQLLTVWLKSDCSRYIPQLYSWYLEFADELKKDPSIAYRLVELCPVDADCQTYQKCGGILVSIARQIKSVVFKQLGTRQRAQTTVTMNPIALFFKRGKKWARDEISLTIIKTTVNMLQGLNSPQVDEILLTELYDFPDTGIKEELVPTAKKALFNPSTPESLTLPLTTLACDLLKNSRLATKYEILFHLFAIQSRAPSETSLSSLAEIPTFAPSPAQLGFYSRIAPLYAEFLHECINRGETVKALNIAISMEFTKTPDVRAILKKHIDDYDTLLIQIFMAQLADSEWRRTSTEHFLPQLLHIMLSPYYIKKDRNVDLIAAQELYEFVYTTPINRKFYQYALIDENQEPMPVVSLSSTVIKTTDDPLPSEMKFSQILSTMLTFALQHIREGKITLKSKLNLLDFVSQCIRNRLEVTPQQPNLEDFIHEYIRVIEPNDPTFDQHTEIAAAIVRTALVKNTKPEQSDQILTSWQHLGHSREKLQIQKHDELDQISQAIEQFDHSASLAEKTKNLDAILTHLYIWQEFYFISAYSERLNCLRKLFTLCASEDRLVASDHIKKLLESVLVPNCVVFGQDKGPLGHEHALQCVQEYIERYLGLYETHADLVVKNPKPTAKATTKPSGRYTTSKEELAALAALEPLLQMFKKATYCGLYKDHYEQFVTTAKRLMAVMTHQRKLNIECFITFIAAFTTVVSAPGLDKEAREKQPELILYWLETIKNLDTPLMTVILNQACYALVDTDMLDEIGIKNLPTLSKIIQIFTSLPATNQNKIAPSVAIQISRIKGYRAHTSENKAFIRALPPFISRLITLSDQ